MDSRIQGPGSRNQEPGISMAPLPNKKAAQVGGLEGVSRETQAMAWV